MRFRLDLSYDGTGFYGWASQPELRTVQSEIEHALALILRLDDLPRLTVAGRTDAGVHARGQVAHVDLADDVEPARLLWRLRNLLDHDIQINDLSTAAEGFDARFSALRRRYVYRICDRPEGPEPLRRHEIYHHRAPLDVIAMNAAEHDLLGQRDFAAYCKPRVGATTIRTLHAISTARRSDGIIETTVVADAFCHSMVRALMGALITIGEAKYEPAWAGTVLRNGIRLASIEVMPAHGLTLEEVVYPPEHLVAHRAIESRRRRRPAHAGIGLAPLSQRGLEQLAAGDLDAARVESGLRLDDAFGAQRSAWSEYANRVATDIRNTGWSVHAVLNDGESVGYAAFVRAPDADQMVEIEFAIFEPHRRRGLARAAVSALISYARQSQEVRVLRACMAPDNRGGLAAIARHGFQHKGTCDEPDAGTEQIWELRLDG